MLAIGEHAEVIRKTNDAVRILDKLFVKGSHRKRRAIEREKERMKIAEQLLHANMSTPPEPLPSARGYAQTLGVFLVVLLLAGVGFGAITLDGTSQYGTIDDAAACLQNMCLRWVRAQCDANAMSLPTMSLSPQNRDYTGLST